MDKADPIKWIKQMAMPSWDDFFMSMVFMYAMKSPDQETKQGCIIVDWPSKIPIGFGFNGHPRRTVGLPTLRPDKYPMIIHADANAVANTMHSSTDAVVYLSMTPCEGCLGLMANMPFVKINRIVYFEDRHFENTEKMMQAIHWIKYEKYKPGNIAPQDMLAMASTYASMRQTYTDVVSVDVTHTYK